MKLHSMLTTAMVALALTIGAAPATLAESPKPMKEKHAKKLLKKGKKAIKEAQEAVERGQAGTAAEEVSRAAGALEQVNEALEQGNVKENDILDVAERVDQAALSHIPVLEGLLSRVPEQARPAIERALAVSRRGHDTATEAILNRGGVSLPAGRLDNRSARDAMQKNEALLDHARRARELGDEGAVLGSAHQFVRNLDQVNRAIALGQVDEWQAESVLSRVERNTSRHLGVLEDLLGQVPEQARPAIERAILASQRGRQAARAALLRTPAAGIQAGRPGSAGHPPVGVGGRPGGSPGGGPPSGRGGRPDGAGPPF